MMDISEDLHQGFINFLIKSPMVMVLKVNIPYYALLTFIAYMRRLFV